MPPHPQPASNALDTAVIERRKALRDSVAPEGMAMPPTPADSAPLWGLALSGGGIRSATFCLGVLRSLAANGVLLRFDLLSTVSGGGYIAGMLGRLFDRAKSGLRAAEVNAAIARAEVTHFGWWLRANGRYLTPAGMRDTLFAGALYLRNLIAIHVEFGIIAMLMALILCAIDLMAWQVLAFSGHHTTRLFDWIGWIPPWMPTLWLVAIVVLLLAARFLLAYWHLQWVRAEKIQVIRCGVITNILAAGIPALGLYFLGRSNYISRAHWHEVAIAAATVFMILSACAAVTAHSVAGGPRGPISAARNALTHRLSNHLRLAGAFLGLGVIERLAWQLAFEGFSTINFGLALGVTAIGLRSAAPLFAAEGRRAPAWLRRSGTLVLQAAGYLLTICLAIWWTTLVLRLVMSPVFPISGNIAGASAITRDAIELDFAQGWISFALIASPVILYVFYTGWNVQFLNLSSLHTFYAARLTRAYLGAANGVRFGPNIDALDPIAEAVRTGTPLVNIGEVDSADDVDLRTYAPHQAGGPVHIINSCVNQSAADDGRLFNRDRKGMLLSVMAGGASQLGQEGWRHVTGIGRLTLGTWLAISGAAVAPGLGARTQRGLAALLTFAGVRLGYWLTHAAREPQDGQRHVSWWRHILAKSVGLYSETTGTFAAAGKNDWFISDGAHFENTGAYALLAAQAQLIVVADCGADPDFRFADLENLVRKARIDLDTHIAFQQPRAAPPNWSQTLSYFGSLNELTSSDSSACLALATIRYPKDSSGHDIPAGILIVIKPNMCAGLPMDIENYRLQCPAFPQQPTSDQFFNETQWESYFSLGRFLADKINAKFLESVIQSPRSFFEPDDLLAGASHARLTKVSSTTSGNGGMRLPPRIGVAAVGATLSAGALATIGISAWQAAEGMRTSINSRITGERTAMKELIELWAKLPPIPPTVSADASTARKEMQSWVARTPEARTAATSLAATIVRTADAYCQHDDVQWLRTSALGVRVVRDAANYCQAQSPSISQACTVLLDSDQDFAASRYPTCIMRQSPRPIARYWGYDYSAAGTWDALHPCSPRRIELVDTEEHFRETNSGVFANPTISDGALNDVRQGRCPPISRTSLIGQQSTLSTTPPATGDGPFSTPSPATPTIKSPAETNTPPASSSPPLSGPATTAASAEQSRVPKPWTLPSTDCKRLTIYAQIYGPKDRDAVRGLRNWWREWGANVPPIEDVIDSSRRAGRADPKPVDRTVLRYHDASGKKCAEKIASTFNAAFGEQRDGSWTAEPLRSGLTPSSGVIEVWVSPGDPLLQRSLAEPEKERAPER